MTTSLAQQLNALQLQQKDALIVPKRARISFLFDSKQAANIDDQTLYYICKAGISEIKQSLDLQAFENDILNENSLRFYRGKETKETNDLIDEQVGVLLKVLSPFLLEQSALKILEYLIRIYEVHIFHKQQLLLAFIPLFETVYFLRISQCLQLKDDQVWGWLNEFAYQGQSIDKQTLTKCISRSNGLVFCLCAKYALEVKGELHIKWFGTFLSEVIKINSNEGLMFNVLPFISQSLKQGDSKDLRVSCLLALGQIACRRTLTPEYVNAFTRQILQTITSQDQLEFDDNLKLKGLTSLLFFTQYQSVKFEQKHFQLIQRIPKLARLLEQLSLTYDTSSLCKSILENNEIQELRPIIKPLLNLKSVFQSVQNLLGNQDETEQVKQKLELINELQPDYFKQSVIFVLKQTQGQQRQKIIQLLKGEFKDNFGSDINIVSALSSEKKINRDLALNSLSNKDYVKELSQKETALVQLILIQVLQHGAHDQETLELIISSISNFQNSDVEYEALLTLLDQITSGKLTYKSQTRDHIIALLCLIKVIRVQNTHSQAWLIMQSNTDKLNVENPFLEFVQNVKSRTSEEVFIQKLKEKPHQAIQLLVGLFQELHLALDYSLIAKLLKKIGQMTAKDVMQVTVVEQLYMPILSEMKKRAFPFVNELLLSMTETDFGKIKFVKKFIGVSLVQKQYNQQVDLQILHKKIFQDKQKSAELLVIIAVSSQCKVKRMFAIQALTAIHCKTRMCFQAQLSMKIMIGVVLMLLNDSDRQIRENGLLLADSVILIQSRQEQNIELIDIFTDTDKPQSIQKKTMKLTPMKSKSVSSLLQDILDQKVDLILDRVQLQQVLSKHSKPEVFEEILRTLLDYPTFELKQKLLEVLTLPQKHPMIFCMNLSQQLQKLFAQIDKSVVNLNYIRSIGLLISQLQEYSVKNAQKEILTSLTIPYIKFVVEKKFLNEVVYNMFDHNILITDLMKEVDQRVLKEIFKIYIKAAVNQTKLRHLFIQRCTGIYKGDDLSYCLTDSTNLELAFETILQLSPSPSQKLFDQAFLALNELVEKHNNDEDVAYLLELCTQVVLVGMPTKLTGTPNIKAIVDKVWLKTKQLVEKGLQQEGNKIENPFDEFMKDQNEDESDDEQVDLLSSLQVTISVLNLMTIYEQRENSLINTTELLGKIADYLVQICMIKDGSASVQSQIKSQLYHLYQSLCIRTFQRNINNTTKIVVKYIESCIQLVDYGAMSKQLFEQQLILNTLKTVPDQAALIVFTLLHEANKREVTLESNGSIRVDITSGSALLLAQEILLWQIDFHSTLQTVRDLFYLVHQVCIIKEKEELIESQTEILFNNYTQDYVDASLLITKNDDSKTKRRMIFLTCTIFTQWFVNNNQFLSRLSMIAGNETPTTEVQQHLLHLLLSSYIMREQVSQIMISQSSQSLIRLQSAIAKWQHTLNEMISLQIHVQLVMKILDMPVQALKINTLCLLLDKFATFSSGWLSKSPANLQRAVISLVEKCVQMLEVQQPESLAQLLLNILSRTASSSLPQTLQNETIKITMQYNKGSLQLQTQTILTEMSLMETYSFAMLDYFHLYFKHTLDGFQTTQTQFVDTYKHALLKSLVCISSIFLKFCSADQLEQVIQQSILCAAQGVILSRNGDLVEIILENISSEAVNHKKLVLQATMNTYSMFSNPGTKGFDTLSNRYFNQLLAPVIRRLPQSFICEHNQKFVVFFKQMYSFAIKNPNKTNLVVSCFNAFILKMNEETLRPIIMNLAKWSSSESSRKIVFFEILCGCLNTLREFFVPMVKIYFDSITQTVIECHKNLSSHQLLTKRSHMEASESFSKELLIVTCQLAELNYKYDSSNFLQNDSFEVLCDPIANLFELISIPDFEKFVSQNLKPLILEMDERTHDDNMWQKMNMALLMKTRSDDWQTRLAILEVIDHLFEKMRERYLVILNDTIPFISELLEDENENVELKAKSIVNRIEMLTGESINEYLK